MVKRVFVVFLFLGLRVNIYCSSGFEFLKIEPDAGIASRGGGIAEGSFITGVNYNPALIGEINKNQFGFSYSRWFMDGKYSFAGIGGSFSNDYKFGVSVVKFDSGEMEERDVNGVKVGSYSNYDQSVNLNFGIKKENLSLGVGFKYIESKIYDIKGRGFGFDLGFVKKLSVLPLDLGVSLLNFGKGIKYIDEREKLPTIFRLSFGLRSISVFRIVGDISYNIYDKANEIRIGSEYGIDLGKVGGLYLRGGIYNLEKGFGSFGGGFGLRMKNINFDTGIVSNKDLGNITRITLNTLF
jgi:hypothetical protein